MWHCISKKALVWAESTVNGSTGQGTVAASSSFSLSSLCRTGNSSNSRASARSLHSAGMSVSLPSGRVLTWSGTCKCSCSRLIRIKWFEVEPNSSELRGLHSRQRTHRHRGMLIKMKGLHGRAVCPTCLFARSSSRRASRNRPTVVYSR